MYRIRYDLLGFQLVFLGMWSTCNDLLGVCLTDTWSGFLLAAKDRVVGSNRANTRVTILLMVELL
jgi:hypothetical protein